MTHKAYNLQSPKVRQVLDDMDEEYKGTTFPHGPAKVAVHMVGQLIERLIVAEVLLPGPGFYLDSDEMPDIPPSMDRRPKENA